jgi:SAM-dependent methyltransferase
MDYHPGIAMKRVPILAIVARVLRKVWFEWRRGAARPLPGRFQTYNHTLPDRYPWLFGFAQSRITDGDATRILSFGCSRGDEVFSLRKYFPAAVIKGIDIDPANIAQCLKRAQSADSRGISFAVAATTAEEVSASYDAIFCLAVLCRSDLTKSGAQRCDPDLSFADFERVVADFARCLKPGGFLFLHTAIFRFGDTAVAQDFDVALEAEPEQLAPAMQFDRNDQLLPGTRYRPVAFRKHAES